MGKQKSDQNKELKTNAMRILDRNGIPYEENLYQCDEFIDGVHVADQLGQDYAQSFKTLVLVGRSRKYYVFVLPVAEELDLKVCAKTVGEKSVEMVPVKEINAVTGYIRGGCTPIGMKKQYPTVIHESALNFDRIYISGGRLGSQILINPRDLIRVTRAVTADIIMHPSEPDPQQ
ncbi:MAG: Cys-tRNA(Pro) deacylase [Lachnospiraceae bacterium]|jgi:Cys-tRNA(Pro)/Cys-tRNA(Cys) deacylase